MGSSGGAERTAHQEAERRGWTFERLIGDLILLRKLVDGECDDDVLFAAPGERVAPNYGPSIVDAVIDG